ncbi:unnamed protein product [Adineta ricciae]|uniref:G-protein coupled receptors family 1 profile domain-containing protein n=1 Tax=Adineta ricciae TaxID=249248 RepID=A0A814VH21_ADIRI|nr:unnamed protein product [Adineta ricciae]
MTAAVQPRDEPAYISLLKPSLVGQLYSWGYLCLFVLGFTGNISSLLTFTRPTLRSVSTGLLFIILASSDTIFLLVSIIDFLDFGLAIPLVSYVNYTILCRVRLFTASMTQICSAWVLVVISLDRWIRTRFPYKSSVICTQKKALLAVAIILILDIGIHAVMLTPLVGTIYPGVALLACGPATWDYLYFYYITWTVIQVFINCLVPVIVMLFFLIDMFIRIRAQKRNAGQQIEVQSRGRISNPAVRRNNRLQTQLFVMMLSSIAIFLATNLPVAVYRTVFPRQVLNIPITEYSSVAKLSAIFQVIWSVNYTINFYIHCLTSTLFRREFRKCFGSLCRSRDTQVTPVTFITVR